MEVVFEGRPTSGRRMQSAIVSLQKILSGVVRGSTDRGQRQARWTWMNTAVLRPQTVAGAGFGDSWRHKVFEDGHGR